MRTIREQAFADTECKTVILSPGIHEVEKWAFRNSRLEQLYIYDDLEKISDYAFQDCDMLRTLHINSIEAPAYSGNYFDTFQDKYDRLLSLKDKRRLSCFPVLRRDLDTTVRCSIRLFLIMRWSIWEFCLLTGTSAA